MNRGFQFSLARLLLVTGWLSLSAAAAGYISRIGLHPSQKLTIIAIVGVFMAGIVGAVRAMCSPRPVRLSFVGAGAVLAGTAMGIAVVILMRWLSWME